MEKGRLGTKRRVSADCGRGKKFIAIGKRERVTILSQSLHLVLSLERPKGKTLLIASRIDSSKVGRRPRPFLSLSLSLSPRPPSDRSDAVFARPLTPLFKGFQNAADAAAGALRISRANCQTIGGPKKV